MKNDVYKKINRLIKIKTIGYKKNFKIYINLLTSLWYD